jgi:glutathione synthase/RimK-type ligase-like ATP-grasp enzyme/ribosomal protein S18 acetylase RimI-like enzyme
MTATSSELRLRTGVLADLDELVRLEEASFDHDRMSRRSLRRAITSPTGLVVVAVDGSGLLASAVVFVDERWRLARVYSIAVDAKCRNQGLGRALLTDVEQRSAERGCLRLRLEAEVGPHGPVGFYKRLGYHEVGHLPGYYENGADGVRMEKSLLPFNADSTRPLVLIDRSGFQLPEDLPAQVMTLHEYVNRASAAPGRSVINLARSYEMLSKGYYASLLAEARGEVCLPHASDLLDINWKRLHRQALDEFSPLVRRAIGQDGREGYFDVHFGRTADRRLAEVAAQLFERFRCPVLRVFFDVDGGLEDIEALRADKAERTPFLEALQRYLTHGEPPIPVKANAISIAMLVDPDEVLPPSNPVALAKFEDAALDLGARITRITKRDLHRLSQFDALFIRETTALDHHTYRFARRAALERLCVIDTPEAILRCSNKIYLHERLRHANVPVPRTVVFDQRDLPLLAATESYPLVLKIPDGSFSRGVHLVDDAASLQRTAEELFARSDLLLVQEFLPTTFDWRIGVMNGDVLFACRYYMAPEHWQIYHHQGGEYVSGASDCVHVDDVPRDVLDAAVRAAAAVGAGLFGIDLKEGPNGPVVIEVNDNPNIDEGVEDLVLGEEVYRRILRGLIAPLLEGARPQSVDKA